MNIITKLAYNALTKTIQAIAPGGVSVPLASSESGSYVPVISGASNVAVATNQLYYTRINKMVTVTGKFSSVDVVAASTSTEFFITLPIPSALTSSLQLTGIGTHTQAGTAYASVQIIGDAAGDKAQFAWHSGGDLAARELPFTFTYEIL